MPAPVHIDLEFARARDSGDPYAFSFAPQTYLLRTPGGGASELVVEWDQALLEQLSALQRPGGDPAVARALGGRLRAMLEPAGWGVIETQLTEEIHAERPVHMTIRSSAAELYTLPWELVTVRGIGLALGAVPTVLLRYEWPSTSTRPSRRAPRGRVLVAWSDAGGEVPHEQHLASIRKSAGEPSVTLPDVSVRALAKALGDADDGGPPIDALHLLCHGGAEGERSGLLLHRDVDTFLAERGGADEDDDAANLVSADALARALVPHADMLRLVVLAACSSGDARVTAASRLGGVAQMLHRAGVQAVVASRLPLSVTGSRRLTEELYEALYLRRETLEQAVLAAKRALCASAGADHDWASLQLYARAHDGDQSDILGLVAAGAATPTPAQQDISPRTASRPELAAPPSVSIPPDAVARTASRRVSAPSWLWPVVAMGSVIAICTTLVIINGVRGRSDAAAVEVASADPAERPEEPEEPKEPAKSASSGETAAPAKKPDLGAASQRPTAPRGPADATTSTPPEEAPSTSRKPPRAPTKKPANNNNRRRKPTLTLKRSGTSTLSDCSLHKPECKARWSEAKGAASAWLPALERCYRGLPPESFIDKQGEYGTLWTLYIELSISASGDVKPTKVFANSLGPTPTTCIKRVVAGTKLPASALSSYRIRVDYNNQNGLAAMRYAGWDPEKIVDGE